MSELIPAITEDEIEREPDPKRDEEIKGDKPPHHGDFSGLLSVVLVDFFWESVL